MDTFDDRPIRIIDDITPLHEQLGPAWRILVVNDQRTVLELGELSDLALAGIELDHCRVSLFFAASASAAQRVLAEHGHESFAVALIDVAMEDATAGLRLVEHIRHTLGNKSMRLLMRTGANAVTSQDELIHRYDLEGFYVKTDMRTQPLIDLVKASLSRWQECSSPW
jgi:CheY-like chemotaxis protein